MGREVRMVPPDWEHPTYTEGANKGRYHPQYDEVYEDVCKEWINNLILWTKGEHPDQQKESNCKPNKDDTYWEWEGEPPERSYYRERKWTPEEATHYQMYEDTSEGTPISPVFEKKEDLAHWLADNSASAFADMTATYDQWLNTINQGYAVSAVMIPGEGMKSGVEAQ